MKKFGIGILLAMVFLMFLSLNSVKAATLYPITFGEEIEKLSCSKTLYKGSKGEQVKILQERLDATTHCNLGYEDENGNYYYDGSFGSKTDWCVRKYQEEKNLEVDGRVGPATCASLNSYSTKGVNRASLTITEVSNNFLNVRADATTSSKDLGDVHPGEVYEIYGYKTNSNGTKWYKIEYEKGKFGYISGNYTTQNFILLDISEQNLKLYRSGRVSLNVPVITGNKSKKHDTPLGIYEIGTKLKAKEPGSKNPDERIHLSKYDAYVDYWMPFIGGSYGFHDADWRTSSQLTNKKTYLTNGSHGCVNMFTEDAKYLYENIYKGLAVYIVE